MATSFAAPAPSADFSGTFDSAFDDISPDTSSTSAPEAPAPETPEQTDNSVPDTSLELSDDTDLDADQPEQIQQDGKNAYKMTEAHMKGLTQARDYMNAVQDILPTPDAARDAYQAASDFRAMEMDFRNPDALVDMPDGSKMTAAEAWMEHWAGVSPEGMAAVGQKMLGFLEKTGNQQVLRAVEGQVSNALVNRTYNQARQAVDQFGADSQQAKNAIYKAQALDYAINGKHRTIDQLPKVDPNQNRVSELERREQAQRQREDAAVTQQWKSAEAQHISGPKDAALSKQVDAILTPLKDKFTPKVFQSMRKEIVSEAQQALKGQFEWSRNHSLEIQDIQREFQKAQRTGQPTNNLGQRVQALVQDYDSRLTRIIPSIAKSFISDATKQTVSQNEATHRQLANGARQAAPSGGGRPTPRSIVPPIRPGASVRDSLDAILG